MILEDDISNQSVFEQARGASKNLGLVPFDVDLQQSNHPICDLVVQPA